MERLERGAFILQAEIIEYDSQLQLLSDSFLIVLLVSTLAFILWNVRVLRNLEPLGRNPESSTRDAILWWFVPLLWLWKPYMVMREIWAMSHDEGQQHRLLIVWWASWLMAHLAFIFQR